MRTPKQQNPYHILNQHIHIKKHIKKTTTFHFNNHTSLKRMMLGLDHWGNRPASSVGSER